MLPCGCDGDDRPVLEHNIECKHRLTFFGAPDNWGPGKYNEIRFNKGRFFIYGYTWMEVIDKNDIKKYIIENRKQKLKKLK